MGEGFCEDRPAFSVTKVDMHKKEGVRAGQTVEDRCTQESEKEASGAKGRLLPLRIAWRGFTDMRLEVTLVQAQLGDTAGSVPDHLNKAGIPIK